jgi:hypothetical protein
MLLEARQPYSQQLDTVDRHDSLSLKSISIPQNMKLRSHIEQDESVLQKNLMESANAYIQDGVLL